MTLDLHAAFLRAMPTNFPRSHEYIGMIAIHQFLRMVMLFLMLSCDTSDEDPAMFDSMGYGLQLNVEWFVLLVCLVSQSQFVFIQICNRMVFFFLAHILFEIYNATWGLLLWNSLPEVLGLWHFASLFMHSFALLLILPVTVERLLYIITPSAKFGDMHVA